MTGFGLSAGYVLVQVLNLVLLMFLIGWPVVSIVTLFHLRQQDLPPTAQALWVLIILAVPYLGTLAFVLVVLGEKSDGSG